MAERKTDKQIKMVHKGKKNRHKESNQFSYFGMDLQEIQSRWEQLTEAVMMDEIIAAFLCGIIISIIILSTSKSSANGYFYILLTYS